ncbi:MAG: efflux transporter outer membrane subunit, partial [Azovibrio sp.]
MTESATAQTEATQEDVHGVRISVAAEVGRAYFSLRGAQREREACLASILSLEKTLELTRQRVKAGDLAPAELDRVQAQLDGLRATLPEIEGRIRASALGLGTLTGGLPEQELSLQDSQAETQTKTQAAIFNLPQVPVGERADLLRRRPDIRAAERRLAASTAEIGVAVAEQFPKLKIGASGGFQALESGDLFSGDSRLFSIAPLISWRIFDGGRVKAQIRSAEAKQQMAALAYEKAVLAGLGDGERTLSDYHFALESLNRQKTAVATALRVHASMQERFRAGDVTLLDVLAAEQQLDAARITEARLATYAATNLVALFRALGGGWEFEQGAEPNTGALSGKT